MAGILKKDLFGPGWLLKNQVCSLSFLTKISSHAKYWREGEFFE
jgi:hypothetical protein